jgi:hypothetical protein
MAIGRIAAIYLFMSHGGVEWQPIGLSVVWMRPYVSPVALAALGMVFGGA